MATPPALALGGAVLGGGLSIVSAREQNRSIRRSMASANESLATSQIQLSEQAKQAREERRRQLLADQGRSVVLAAERGVSLSGSVEANALTADLAAERDRTSINTNLRNRVSRERSETQSVLTRLASGSQSPILSGAIGALQGFQTGLSLDTAIENLAAETATGNPTTNAAAQAYFRQAYLNT